MEEAYRNAWFDPNVKDFISLSRHITKMCKGRKIALMIDEVDKMSNNLVFLHFLGMLRSKFLGNQAETDYTFHSVILAGVYDIKNIKLMMINEGTYTPTPTENKIYNSPWNIAAISGEIYSYTSGYPFLVSRICKYVDEKLIKDWTVQGIQDAVKIMLNENNTLFDDIFKNLENNRELYDFIHSLLIEGEVLHFVIHDPVVATGVRYRFFSNLEGRVAISNRIFELLMTDYFISAENMARRAAQKGSPKAALRIP